jgi:hypothetical protein
MRVQDVYPEHRPASRPLFEDRGTAVRQFVAGALVALAFAGAGYALAPHDHPQHTTTTTTTR